MKFLKWCLFSFLILMVSMFVATILVFIFDKFNISSVLYTFLIGLWFLLSGIVFIKMTLKVFEHKPKTKQTENDFPNGKTRAEYIEELNELIISEEIEEELQPSDDDDDDDFENQIPDTNINKYIKRSNDNKLPRKFLYPRKDLEDKSHYFYGKKVVLTGEFDNFPRRQEMAKMLWEVGADVDTSLTVKTDVLVSGEDSGWRKLEKAKEYKTKVLGEKEFLSYFPDYITIF